MNRRRVRHRFGCGLRIEGFYSFLVRPAPPDDASVDRNRLVSADGQWLLWMTGKENAEPGRPCQRGVRAVSHGYLFVSRNQEPYLLGRSAILESMAAGSCASRP